MPKSPSPTAPSFPASPTTSAGPAVHAPEETNDLATKIATVAVVGVAAALIEAELIPGMLLGMAAVIAPDFFRKGLRPVVKSVVKAGYSIAGSAREAMAEASEQFDDIVAEVQAEQTGAAENPAEPAHTKRESRAKPEGGEKPEQTRG